MFGGFLDSFKDTITAPFDDGFDVPSILGTLVGMGATVGVATYAIAAVGRAGSAAGGGGAIPKAIGKLEMAWIALASGKVFKDLTGDEQSQYRKDFAALYRRPDGSMKSGATARLKRGY